jgi:hypothetical protein
MADRWIPGLGRRYGVFFRGSKGEGKKLARGSLVCVPSDLTRHGEYDEDAIRRLIDEIEKQNEAGEEVPVDSFLALCESEAVCSTFLENASRVLGKRLTSIDLCLRELHDRLKVASEKIVAYASSADTASAAIAALDIRLDATLSEARSSLENRIDREKERYAALSRRFEAERATEDIEEQLLREEENNILLHLADNQNILEQKLKAAEEHVLLHAEQQMQLLDKIASLFAVLKAPETWVAWLAENLFPWVRNAKAAALYDLASFVEQHGFGICHGGDIGEMRAHITSILRKRRLFEDEQARVDRERKTRTKLRESKWHEISDPIEADRIRRGEKMRANQATRQLTLDKALEDFQAAERAPLRLSQVYADFADACRQITNDDAPERLDQLVGKIDTTLRVQAFLIATHYWEARFLLGVKRSGWREQSNRTRVFRLLAMLAPCFVSTFDKMGSVFNIMKQDGLQPMWALADTLIVDEAGQASPDKGAFAFCFAKKALVVGDNLQLPPVNSTEAGTYLTSIARSANLLDNQVVAERGLLAGKIGNQQYPGSIMRMCSAAAYFDMSKSTQGMWLRDHFRCDPRIIAFSNRIWYTGDTSLIPRRSEKPPFIVPHFGHLHVSGRMRNKSNEAEAEAIVRWIDMHGPRLQEHYGKPIHEVVAVLTPFANQGRLLRTYRDKRFKWRNEFELPQEITMGTVHALQGAERSVILFSTVYDEPKPRFFFDREHTLLNVAVSRAKDSFIVVGDKRIFDGRRADASQPSSLLREHIFNGALADVPPLHEQTKPPVPTTASAEVK